MAKPLVCYYGVAWLDHFAHLEDLYRRINTNGHDRLTVVCPGCEKKFEVEVDPSGER